MFYDRRRKLILPSRFRQRGSIQMGSAGAMAAAGAGGAALTWTLSSLATSYADVGGATQTYAVQVIFQVDATVDVFRDIAADLLNEQIDYVSALPTTNTWVRCLYISGDHMTAGAAEDTWHNLNVTRIFTMRIISPGGPSDISGVFNFELSSDSSGSPIEASKNNVNINAGEIF